MDELMQSVLAKATMRITHSDRHSGAGSGNLTTRILARQELGAMIAHRRQALGLTEAQLDQLAGVGAMGVCTRAAEQARDMSRLLLEKLLAALGREQQRKAGETTAA